MPESGAEPRALFLFPDEPPQPDAEVCSGRYRNWLGGEPCPYSEAGRMPWPERAEAAQQEGGPEGVGAQPEGGLQGGPASQERGLENEPTPRCVEARLGRLSDWRGERGLQFPQEMGGQPLHKCKQMFLLVLAPGWEGGLEAQVRRDR